MCKRLEMYVAHAIIYDYTNNLIIKYIRCFNVIVSYVCFAQRDVNNFRVLSTRKCARLSSYKEFYFHYLICHNESFRIRTCVYYYILN